MAKTKSTRTQPAKAAPPATKSEVPAALEWLKKRGSKKRREEMGPRYGIQEDKAFGVAMADILKLAKRVGKNHALAAALWDTGWYEARMLASLIDEPELVTPGQMERWVRDFNNWGICDTVCFKLFDQTPHAFSKVMQWSNRREEFVRRAAFALLACLALHDKDTANKPFLDSLDLIEQAAEDERNFVKKAVNWALRAIGRRNRELNLAAVKVAQRLAASPQAAAQWVGKDALREIASPAVTRKLAAGKRSK